MSKEEWRELIETELLDLFTPADAEKWWTIPNNQLEGKTPEECIDKDYCKIYYLVAFLGG